jgi:hypothetical protein
VTLERNLQNSKTEAFDLFFLAMSYQRLGDATKAGDYYKRAMLWWQAHDKEITREAAEELEAFRAEADVLLKKLGEP